MQTYDAQNLVAQAVEARGYRDGWTPEQFAARQVAKLVEETAELSQAFGHLTRNQEWMPYSPALIKLGETMRAAFDCKDVWDRTTLLRPENARKELADVVVVCLTLADALGFDVVEAAYEKATKDISRGVRNG